MFHAARPPPDNPVARRDLELLVQSQRQKMELLVKENQGLKKSARMNAIGAKLVGSSSGKSSGRSSKRPSSASRPAPARSGSGYAPCALGVVV